jgi:protein-disulfide isomerase
MSDQREREKRREERVQAESKVDAKDRRQRMLQLAAGAVFLAIVAVVVVIVVTASSGGSGGDTELEGVAEVEKELAGLHQSELVVGDPEAPVELIEFGDLQCPVCAGFANEILPPVIAGQVNRGEVKIAFRNFTIIGPESTDAGTAALAAGAQHRGWQFLDIFYRNQGGENSGYVDDAFLTAVAKAASVPDIARWNEERKSSQFAEEVKNTSAEAKLLGFNGTPSFAIETDPSTRVVDPIGTPESTEELEAAIEDAS